MFEISPKTNPKQSEIFTVPNLLTATRLALSPLVAKKLQEDPKRWWLRAGLFAASDVADGFLARTGDKNPVLKRLGFRTSEVGRKLDPVTDKITTSQLIVAGVKSEVVPKSLAAATLGQKAIVAGVSLMATSQDREIQVTKLGKYSEFMTNLGIGSLFIAESIDNPSAKSATRTAGAVMATAGIAAALVATADYAQQAFSQTKQ